MAEAATETGQSAIKGVLDTISNKITESNTTTETTTTAIQSVAAGVEGVKHSTLGVAKNLAVQGKIASAGAERVHGILKKTFGLSLSTFKMQARLAKAGKVVADKVFALPKMAAKKVMDWGGNIMGFLKKGLGLASLYALFWAIKNLDIEGIWKGLKGWIDDIFKAWESEPGNIWQKFVAAFSEGLRGAFNFIFDAAQWLGDIIDPFWDKFVGWFGNLIGLDESTIKAIQDFELVEFLREQTMAAINWLEGLFKWEGGNLKNFAKLIDLVLFTFNLAWMAVKAVFTWVTGEELSDKSFGELVVAAFMKAWEWVKGLWEWGKAAGTTEAGEFSFSKLALAAWEKVKEWFTSLVAWMDEGGVESFIQTTVDKVVTTVKEWFTKLFTWAETEDATDSFIVKFIKDKVKAIKYWFGQLFSWWTSEEVQESWIVKTLMEAVDGAKAWLGKLFNFGSAEGVLKSYINFLTFFPNIIKDAVLSAGAWLLGLFGFDDAAKTVANAKKFSIGDLVFDAIMAIWDWMKGLLDIDVAAIAKSIPGGETLLKWIKGENIDAEQDIMKSMGLEQGTFDAGDWDLTGEELEKALQGKNKEEIEKMMNAVKSMAEKGKMEERHMPDLMEKFSEAMKNAKAAGGPILKGIPALVGEKGPELFMPSTSGKIIPATQSAGMLGGGGGASIVNAPTTNIAPTRSTNTMAVASSSINPMHNKYFRTEFSNC